MFWRPHSFPFNAFCSALQEESGSSVKLTTYTHFLLRLNKRETVLLPLSTFIAWTRKIYLFTFNFYDYNPPITTNS
jgi:hypothetical protein